MPRTKGSKNGISTTPGYTAIGNVAKVINGIYESQLRQKNPPGGYDAWVRRMAESRRQAENRAKAAIDTAKANATKDDHKPSFNILNTPTAVSQYMEWEKSMQGQQEAALKSAAQKIKATADRQASKNHMVTKGYDGNPTAEIEAKRHATNASYYEPAKMSNNAYYDNSKTKTRTTQGAQDAPDYIDPYKYAYDKSGRTAYGDKRDKDKDFETFKHLVDDPNYDFGDDGLTRSLFESATNSNTKNKSTYQKSNAVNDAGDYQAELARQNAEKRMQEKIQKERDERAAAIRAKKATIDDPKRGSRSTLQNVIRDIRADKGKELRRDIGGRVKRVAKTAGRNLKTSARSIKSLIKKIRSR